MSSHHVHSAILPAILASSAVFSLLTFPFFSYRYPSIAADSSPLRQRLEPILTSENRDLTIRYIGGSMVLGVATGLATVELYRRRKTDRSSQQPATTLEPTLDPFEADVTDLEFDSTDIERLNQLNFAELNFAELISLQSESKPAASLSERYVPIQHSSELASAFTSTAVEPIAQPKGQVTELPETYPTCRIRVKPLARRQFAIQVDGEFYGFFRLLSTREAALETAQQLWARQHLVVITPVERQYAVWVWQPATEIESVSM